jgi:hypothetical protein
MDKATAKRIAKKVDGGVYEDYSGRCMYGETTYGVVLKGYDITPQMRKRYRLDNMGLDYIIY